MAVPKRKTSKSRRDKRRTHDRITPPQLVECPRCGEWKATHRVCPSCGYYAGRNVFDQESE